MKPFKNLKYLLFDSYSSQLFGCVASQHFSPVAFNIVSILEYVGHVTYFHDAYVYCVLLGQNYFNSFHMSSMWLKKSNWNLYIFRLSLCSMFWWLLVLMTSSFDILILSALFLWQLSSSLKQHLGWDCTYTVAIDKFRWSVPELPKGASWRWLFLQKFVNVQNLRQKVLCFPCTIHEWSTSSCLFWTFILLNIV